MTLIARQAALTATAAKFKGPTFCWRKYDCLRLFGYHVRQMGHSVSLAPAGTYTNALGAARALQRSGFDSLPAAIDARGFMRIPPAMALIGDIMALPGEGGLHALQVVAGNGRTFGYHADSDTAEYIQPRPTVLAEAIAWRIEPKTAPTGAAKTSSQDR